MSYPEKLKRSRKEKAETQAKGEQQVFCGCLLQSRHTTVNGVFCVMESHVDTNVPVTPSGTEMRLASSGMSVVAKAGTTPAMHPNYS